MNGSSTRAAACEAFMQICTVLRPEAWDGRTQMLDRLNPVDWATIAKLAVDHGLAGMVARSLEWASQRSDIKSPILERMIAARRGQLVQLMVRRSAARAAGDALTARNIRYLIYKGAVLSEEVYGDLSLRAFRDCDILVPADQFEAAHDALRELGYALPRHELLENYLRPRRYAPGMGYAFSMFHPNGHAVDLHWSPFGLELLPKDPDLIWRFCGPPQWPTVLPGWRYSPELTLINSAMHLYHHGFQGLKSLVDFYVTAINWGDRIDLGRLFETARALEMRPIVDVAARLCGRMFAPHPLVQRLAVGRPSLRARIACSTSRRRLLQPQRVGDVERRFRRLLYCGTPTTTARAIRLTLVPNPGELEVRFREPFRLSMYPRFYVLQVYRILSRSKKPFATFISSRPETPAQPSRRSDRS